MATLVFSIFPSPFFPLLGKLKYLTLVRACYFFSDLPVCMAKGAGRQRAGSFFLFLFGMPHHTACPACSERRDSNNPAVFFFGVFCCGLVAICSLFFLCLISCLCCMDDQYNSKLIAGLFASACGEGLTGPSGEERGGFFLAVVTPSTRLPPCFSTRQGGELSCWFR